MYEAMEMSNNDKLKERIEQILKLNLKLMKINFELPGNISENPEQLDIILNGLHAVTEELDSKSHFIAYRSKRLNEFVEVLLKYTLMDFSQQLDISEKGDELDAIALGLNTLGEELHSHISQLKESEENMRRLVEGVKDYAIFSIDANGYIQSWNAGAERIKGYTAEEITGKHISVFYTEDEKERNEPSYNLMKARELGSHESEGWRLRKDGTKFWADVVFTALYNKDGTVKGFLKITRDVTERKKSEFAMLEKSEDLMRSNKQLEQFVYIASHDLQEPLRTLSNYVGLLQQDCKGQLDKNSTKYLDVIGRATERMQLLITDLLQYARVGQERNIIQINCNLLLKEVLADMAAAIEDSNASIEHEPLPIIAGNYSELKSLFQNLVSNAIKFKKSGLAPVIHIKATENKNEWLFVVTDNGIGIEKQYHERIFAIFQRLHSKKQYAGTGIGLANCKKIVETHKGNIWVESEPGKGSTFYFTIAKQIGK